MRFAKKITTSTKTFFATVKLHNSLSFADHRESHFNEPRPRAATASKTSIRRQRDLHRHLSQRRHLRGGRTSRRDEKRHGDVDESSLSKDVMPGHRLLESSAVRRQEISQLLRVVVGGEQGPGRADVRVARHEARKYAESSSSAAEIDPIGRVGGELSVVDCHRFARFAEVSF